jgi:hypothetical protein
MLANLETVYRPVVIHPLFIAVDLILVFVSIASMWKTYTKAGEQGCACLVPIYNIVVLLRMAGKSWWWLLLLLIPLVNFVIMIIVNIDLAKNFGKGTGFGFGLAFLGFHLLPDSWIWRRGVTKMCGDAGIVAEPR